jgi:NitT/TauT family transport system substrate-binding protein
LIVDVLAVRADVPVSAQQALMATVAGHLRAVQWLLDQPEQAAAQLAPHLGMTAQDVGQVMKGIRLIGHQENKDWLQGGQPRLLASASAVGEAMLQSRLLSRDAMLDGLCEPRYLPSGP